MDIAEFTKATGNFLKAEDVMKDEKKIFVITAEPQIVVSEKFQNERLHIPGELSAEKKIFDSSKTNSRTIAKELGTETKEWIGKLLLLEVYKTKTSEGKMVDAINVAKVIPEDEISKYYFKK